jgi:hypothetical protein
LTCPIVEEDYVRDPSGGKREGEIGNLHRELLKLQGDSPGEEALEALEEAEAEANTAKQSNSYTSTASDSLLDAAEGASFPEQRPCLEECERPRLEECGPNDVITATTLPPPYCVDDGSASAGSDVDLLTRHHVKVWSLLEEMWDADKQSFETLNRLAQTIALREHTKERLKHLRKQANPRTPQHVDTNDLFDIEL